MTNTQLTPRQSRLPRRYDKTMKALHELMESKNEKLKLQAVMRISEILMEHDRSIERIAIATERAAERRARSEAEQAALSEVSSEPEEVMDPEEALAREQLRRLAEETDGD